VRIRYAHSINRLKPIFQLAVTSFNETIRPNAHMAKLIHTARAEMKDKLRSTAEKQKSQTEKGKDANAYSPSYIGVHVRRGDQKAKSWAFHNGFVPIANYAQAILETWSRLFPSSPSPSTVYIASDSPSAQRELVNALPQTSVLSLSLSANPELRALASQREYKQEDFGGLGEEERVNATRGMIVDFAMVNGMWTWQDDVVPEATICTIAYVGCTIFFW
jgi:hypothetical protein